MEDIITMDRSDALASMESIANKQKRLAVFSDFGPDDACALLYGLSNRHNYDFIDIVAVGGVNPAEQSLKNARALLAAACDSGADLSGVRIVNTAEYYQPCMPVPELYGRDGMGDLLEPSKRSGVPEIGFKEWLSELSEGYEILSLAPCTMLKKALAYSCTLPGGKIYVAGGAADESGAGCEREYNDALDHDAFKCVLRRPHRAAMADTCREISYDRLIAFAENKPLQTFVGGVIKRSENGKYFRLSDYIAAIAFCRRELFGTRPVFYKELMKDINVLHFKETV